MISIYCYPNLKAFSLSLSEIFILKFLLLLLFWVLGFSKKDLKTTFHVFGKHFLKSLSEFPYLLTESGDVEGGVKVLRIL